MRRTLIEVFHIAVGVFATAFLAAGAVWALPHAADTIWAVAYGVMVVVVAMGIRPLRDAWRGDHGGRSLDE